MKKLLAILCTLAILCSVIPSTFASDSGIIVPFTDFESLEGGMALGNQEKITNGWKRQGAAESGCIVQEANGNKYVKLINNTGGYNEFLNDFTNIDDSVVKSIRITGKTYFHDDYMTRVLILRGSAEAYYLYFNRDRTVTVGSSAMPGFTYNTGEWYNFAVDFNPSTGYVVFSITDSEGTTYTQDGYGTAANRGLFRVDFFTPMAYIPQTSEWGLDDLEVSVIPAIKEQVINSNFSSLAEGTEFTTATEGWRFAANGGSNSYAKVVEEDGNKYVEYAPGTKVCEFLNDFASYGNATYTEGLSLSFKTMFTGMCDRRIMVRSSGEYYYLYFTGDGYVKAGNTCLRNFKYTTGKWYEVTINVTPSTGYVSVVLKDGDKIYEAQGYDTKQSGGVWRINFVQMETASQSAGVWNLDDIALCATESKSEYEKDVVFFGTETFDNFDINTELSGTVVNDWRSVAPLANNSSVMIKESDGNRYASVTAGAGVFTEFYKELYAINDEVEADTLKLTFSLKIDDNNQAKTLYLRGDEGEHSVLTIDADGRVYVGNAHMDENVIPNFCAQIGKWYDYTVIFNQYTGQIYASVEDNGTSRGTWGTANINKKITRVNFVVINDFKEGVTVYGVDNVKLQSANEASWTKLDISDVEYSVNSLTPGEITATLSGQVYGNETKLTLFLALYNKTGRELVDVSVIPVQPEGFAKDFVAKVNVPSDYENYEVRAFLFDDKLIPVQTVASLQ